MRALFVLVGVALATPAAALPCFDERCVEARCERRASELARGDFAIYFDVKRSCMRHGAKELEARRACADEPTKTARYSCVFERMKK